VKLQAAKALIGPLHRKLHEEKLRCEVASLRSEIAEDKSQSSATVTRLRGKA
jgi:hypothetical protein